MDLLPSTAALWGGLGGAIIGGGLYWQYIRSRSLLENWARQNNLELVQHEQRFLRRGPFFWTSSKGQTVFFVAVRDRQGQTRYGWVRCGGWWFGLLTRKTEVRWAE